ncbi:MAG: PhnD/SsuA/transferrin family substrate-binding protein [Planctomycetota bacterium]
MIRTIRTLLSALLASAATYGALPCALSEGAGRVADGPHIAVIQPGYPGSPKDAVSYLARLSKHLVAKTGVAGVSAEYFNLPAEAKKALARKRPTHGIVSLGFYLENREALGLVPLLEVLPESEYLLLAQDSKGGDFAGKKVVGGPLYEQSFLAKVAFPKLKEVPAWEAVPTLRISRSLRKLSRGTYEAAVVTSREYRTLEKLGKLKGLKTVAKSEAFPTALFVAFDARDRGERAKVAKEGSSLALGKRLAEGFRGMSQDSEGKKILETLGCEGSRPVRTRWIEELEKRYDAKDR